MNRKLPFTPAHRTQERDFLNLAHSYFGALDVLFVNLFNKNAGVRPGDAEMLLDPIMFLYRHAIECCLKYFLFSKVVNQPVESHNLKELYETLKPYLKAVPKEKIRFLEDIVDFYAQYDTKGGEAFRYPFGKKSQPFDRDIEDLSRVDLRQIYRNIEGIKDCFMRIAYELGGENATEDFVFHNEFEALEIEKGAN